MKKPALVLILALFSVAGVVAQQNPAGGPASKEDIQKYLDVMHSREMMGQMVDAMIKPMHQMFHEQFLKDQAKLPPDFEDRLNRMMDQELKSFPWDEMIDVMIPVYQKHLTKGDVDALVVFYSGPTGQKLLKDMPVMMGEAMQAMMPMMQKHMQAMTERLQQQVAEMMKDSKAGQPNKAAPVSN